ncbi:MAG TPA: CvpA family protein [Candidatus Marinimicrobia bacterium]|mgnify:CR=1 FL=1|nr:CvpA family protein [Candidatus Neomarinimicrobiota bacterium]HRS52585.1 CvpA family protein [Candidatus Neomarinimicrobiota bacterium]HRU93179.1 CvpA family protein [Candidatus Neomarinimicrobiota bacterium]
MFDLIVAVIIGVCVFLGLRSGLIKSAFKLIGLLLAGLTASRYYYIGGKLIAGLFNLSEGVQAVIGFVIVFIVVFLFFELLASMLRSLLRALKLVWVDRIGGMLFGFLEGAIIMIGIVWVLNVYPELGFVNHLRQSSTNFKFFEQCGAKVVQICGLKPELDHLHKSLRKIVFLPETPTVKPDSLNVSPSKNNHR